MLNFYDNHNKAAAILVYLIPFALITGPFLPDLFLCLVGIYFLFISYKHKLIKYYQNLFVCLDNPVLATKISLLSSFFYFISIVIPLELGHSISYMIYCLTIF